MFRFKYVIILILFFTACSSAEKKDNSVNSSSVVTVDGSSPEADSAETSKQDVKELDLNYSKGFSLSEKKGRLSCKKHIETPNEEWKDLVESALTCIYDKNWVELSKIADKLSHNNLKAPWGPYYKSIVAFERYGDFQRAEWMCNLALKKSPDNTIVNYQLARIYWNTDRKPQAYDLMGKIAKKNPKNSSIQRFLGDIEYSDRNFKKALSHYEKILPVFSRDLNFRSALATSYFYSNKKESSLSHYKFAVRNSKDKAPYLFQIGEVYKEKKNWTMAKAYYLKAMKSGPSSRSIASLSLNKIKVQLDYVDQRLKEASKKGVKNEK